MTEERKNINSIPEIMRNAIQGYPERIALIGQRGRYTYKQLACMIAAGMNIISGCMPSNSHRIALIGDNDPAYIMAYFAAQFLGLSTVEVGRNESLETLIDIVDKTESGFVVTDREDLMTAFRHKVHVKSFDEFIALCEASCAEDHDLLNMANFQGNQREASIIFTSGTTGIPKGVILSHKNFCFIVSRVVEYLKLKEEDRYALMLPLCHTYGKIVALTSFAAGASLIFAENFTKLPTFMTLIAEQKCTIMSCVPYHAHVMLKWGNLSKFDLSSLRAVTFSGNKLPPATIDVLIESLNETEIFSMYGLTESTTRACFVPPKMLAQKKESCGKPLSGVEIKIVSENGKESAFGEVGEVWLRGANVMQGYFGDAEMSKKTLSGGWLKTGDLGQLDEDGFLYLKGRLKDIIKCAGERISSMEVEDALRRHPGVLEVAVKGTSDSLLGEVVHAFIVPVDNTLQEGELRTFCATQLSHHKMPRRYTFVEELKKTATGKVKKHFLKGE